MGRRRKKEGASISLVPILSIQKCAMGVMVVIICAQTMVSIGKTADQYLELAGEVQEQEAVYVECQENKVLIHPKREEASLEALKGMGPSPFHQLLDDLQATNGKKYLVLLIRPEGIATYELCFEMAKNRKDANLRVGKDALLTGGNIVLTTKDGRPILESAKGGR